MTRWRMWLNAVNGLKPSLELVAAMDALDRPAIRRVSRLTRRGEAAANASEARLAVALARQTRQRKPTLSADVTLAVMIAVLLGIFVVQAMLGEIDSFGIVVGALGLWLIAVTIPRRVCLRNAATAERLNREVLQATAEPYSPSWSATRIEVPPAAFATAVLVTCLLYGGSFGLIQFVGETTQSASTVIAKGAFFGVLMTVFQLTIGRNLTERRSERKAEAQLRSN